MLRAIFGEKAGDVRDTSLRVPPGVEGIVIDARIFSRKGTDKDSRSISIETEEIAKLTKDRDDELRIVEEGARERIRNMLVGKEVAAALSDAESGTQYLKRNETVTNQVIDTIPLEALRNISLKSSDAALEEEVPKLSRDSVTRSIFGECTLTKRSAASKRAMNCLPALLNWLRFILP